MRKFGQRSLGDRFGLTATSPGRACCHVTQHRSSIYWETITFRLKILRRDGRGRVRVRDLTWSFFAYSENIDSPESFILPFFTRKARTVTFSEGGYTLSRSQNDKTSNIWQLVPATSTFSLKVVVEWRRLPRFPAKMTLVHARALLSTEKILYSLSYSSQNLKDPKGLYYNYDPYLQAKNSMDFQFVTAV